MRTTLMACILELAAYANVRMLCIGLNSIVPKGTHSAQLHSIRVLIPADSRGLGPRASPRDAPLPV
jgi:hypothetical protein